MSLSVDKLEKLLGKRGFLCKKYYVMDGMCVYIEVLDLSTSDIFMLYIPSKYDIPKELGDNTYLVEYLDVDEDGCVVGDYAGEPDNPDLEQAYTPDQIELDKNNSSGKAMKDFLEEKYDQPVNLREAGKDDLKGIKDTFRHLKRLRLTVKNIKYKLAIAFKNYLCCIRKDDTLEGFVVKKLVETPDRKLFVKLDLETLYDNVDTLSVDIRTVRQGIYNVLNKNHSRHMVNLQKLVINASNVTIVADSIMQKKEKLSGYLTKLEATMERLIVVEKELVDKLNNVRGEYVGDRHGLKSFHTDVEKTHMIAKYESDLSNVHRIKQDIIRNILSIKIKHENLLLRADKIFFDNIVMIDEVIKNINNLHGL